IDLRRLDEIAASAVAPQPAHVDRQKAVQDRIRLAVARDRAFCFYYEDNLDILRGAGAEICFFSPLDDKALPENIDAIYLGGGYPELYADGLSNNEAMLSAIRKWAADDRPLYAECGGFMYLTRGITDQEGRFHALTGIFPTRAVMQTKRARLGYRQITTTTESFFGPPRTQLRGHEFHYSSIEEMKSDIERIYTVGDTVEGYRLGNVLGGYMHLHFGFTPEAAGNFVRFCLDHRKERNK
ncbi:MAG TPA: cobyrinate a,c-diamide synthase, partial [Desulfopila sp.]|nr:cobyrinate a,c-diamide synthase [Desulfopila sp.]